MNKSPANAHRVLHSLNWSRTSGTRPADGDVTKALTADGSRGAWTVSDPRQAADVLQARKLLSEELEFEFSDLKYKPFWVTVIV